VSVRHSEVNMSWHDCKLVEVFAMICTICTNDLYSVTKSSPRFSHFQLLHRKSSLWRTFVLRYGELVIAIAIPKFAATILYRLDCSKNFCLVWFQARDFPDASDVWNLLLSGTVHRNSLSRQDVQELDNHTLYKLADVFNLPRRQSADKLNSVEHTEL